MYCTKGVANFRRNHDVIRGGGRAGRRVARRWSSEEVPPSSPRDMRLWVARLRPGLGRRPTSHRVLSLLAVHPYVHRGISYESQLGNSGRYVAGKRQRLRRSLRLCCWLVL